mmetsp:Transcript_7588/g.18578  ORF Transcript_7588/g.18578 Transcript_7588/m.18578 type:complete len:91 (-) Transcript_7588:247-519(-)
MSPGIRLSRGIMIVLLASSDAWTILLFFLSTRFHLLLLISVHIVELNYPTKLSKVKDHIVLVKKHEFPIRCSGCVLNSIRASTTSPHLDR